MADVIAIIVADVITTLFCIELFGWCYCHVCVVDVITTEADVIAYYIYIYIYWLVLLPI